MVGAGGRGAAAASKPRRGVRSMAKQPGDDPMTTSAIRACALAAALAVGATACTTRQVVENTGDAVAGTTKLAARGVVGAGRLAARGTVAGVRRLARNNGGFEAGTLVCVDGEGTVYAAATTTREGRTACPAVDAASRR